MSSFATLKSKEETIRLIIDEKKPVIDESGEKPYSIAVGLIKSDNKCTVYHVVHDPKKNRIFVSKHA